MEVLSKLGVDLREDELKKALQQLFVELSGAGVAFEIVFDLEDQREGSHMILAQGSKQESVLENGDPKLSLKRPLKKCRN